MDPSIVATALMAIGAHFNDFVRLQWIPLAYLLTDLGFALIFARLSDVTGRKWASILAVTILTIGSLGAGLATSLSMLIVFRAIQGIGGAGVYALPLTVIPEITPAEKLVFAHAACLAPHRRLNGLLTTFRGPTIGGVITTQSSWRWCFLFNVPCGVLAIAILLATWPKKQVVGKLTWSQLDYVGALLIIAATVLLIFALQEAGSGAYAWSSATVVGCLVGGGLAWIALFASIRFLSKSPRSMEPLFPARVAKDRVLAGAFLVATFSGYVIYSVLIELSERLQIVNGRTAQGAGIALLPFLGAAAVGSALAGFLSSGKRNLSFETNTTSSALTLVGCGLLAYVAETPQVPYSLYGYQVILGLGLGGALVSGTIVVKLSAAQRDAASAQGVQAQTRILGGNLGLAIATIILNAQLGADLSGVLSPSELNALKHSLNSISSLRPGQVAAVEHAFARTFHVQILVCIGVSVVSLISCLLVYQGHPRTFIDMKEAGG